MTKKTAKKTAKKKTTKAKTAKKTARTAARDGRKASTAGAPLETMRDSMRELLEEMESLGLVTTQRADDLNANLDGVAAGTLGAGIKAAAKWEKQLTSALIDFEAAGAGNSVSSVHEALLLWQRTLAKLPATRRGLEEALEALRKVIPFSGATIFLRDPEQDQVAPFLSCGFEVDLISRVAFDSGSGFSSWVAGRRKPILYSSIHRNEAPQADVVRSFMAVPLLVADDCMGVLTLGHGEDGFYTPASLRALMVAGSMLAGLILGMHANRRVARLQINDPLSGLMTPAHIQARLKEEVVRCRELGYSMTLAAVELSELTAYAERFGPEYRARTLVEVGALVRDWMQEPEMAGLVDDNRLLLILPGLGGEQRAQERIAGLTRALEAHSFPRRKRLTTSVALASYPADAESPQDLLSYADRTLGDLRVASGSGSTTASMEAA